MDQYITLVSNASMDIFPDNRLSSFRTRLPYLHDFSSGDFAVALTEITYTKSWFNVAAGHYMKPVFMDDSTDVPGLIKAEKVDISPGNYAKPKDLVDHINTLVKKWKLTDSIARLPEYEVKPNQKLAIAQTGKHKLDRYTDRDFALAFDDDMAAMLGITDNRPIYLDQGMTSLFIYCDIVQPQVVGNTFEPLLRTVGVSSEALFGENVTEIFESPYYLPLSRTTFEEVSVNIRNDIGKAPPFNFGRVTVTLHIKPQ